MPDCARRAKTFISLLTLRFQEASRSVRIAEAGKRRLTGRIVRYTLVPLPPRALSGAGSSPRSAWAFATLLSPYPLLGRPPPASPAVDPAAARPFLHHRACVLAGYSSTEQRQTRHRRNRREAIRGLPGGLRRTDINTDGPLTVPTVLATRPNIFVACDLDISTRGVGATVTSDRQQRRNERVCG